MIFSKHLRQTHLAISVIALLLISNLSHGEINIEERLEALEQEINYLRQNQSKAASQNLLERISVNGYINFVLSQSNREVGYWSGENDSLSLSDHSTAGIRFTANMSEKTNAVIQFDITSDIDGGYKPGIEWFYLQHHFDENFSMKAGRLSAPVLNYSEEFEVGFAHPWVRPPEEVYGPLPLNEIEGINFVYNYYAGDIGFHLKGTWGENTLTAGNATLEQKNIFGLEAEFNYKDFTLRASQLQMKLNIDTEVQLTIADGSESPPVIGTVHSISVRAIDTDYSLTSAGFTYDNNTIMFTGELADYRVDKNTPVLANEKGYYLTTGWYLNKFTPYYTYATLKGDDTFALTSLGPAQPIAAREQRGQYLGLRYSITDNAALTVEVQYLDNFGDGIGLFGGPTGAYDGVSIDFDSATVAHIAYQAVF